MVREGDLVAFCRVVDRLTEAIASVATLLAVATLSRATSVTGAAFRGHVRAYQLERVGTSCVVFPCVSLPGVPEVTAVTGRGVSSGLRKVVGSGSGFVLTRFGDLPGAIEDYQAFEHCMGMVELMLQNGQGLWCLKVQKPDEQPTSY